MILPLSLLVLSVVLDLVSNYCIKRSRGFKKVVWGISGIALIICAFALLSVVVQYLPLGVAYSIWGSLGVLGTVTLDRFLFNSRLGRQGTIGIGFIITGIVGLQLA